MLAMLLEGQGRMAEAEKEYRHILALEPQAAVAANNLAWIYVAGNRNLDEALQLAQTAHQALPADVQVTDTLGWIYVRKNMASRGVEQLEACTRKMPKDALFQYHLGIAYMKTGKYDKATQSLKQALSLEPDFEGAADARKALTTMGA